MALQLKNRILGLFLFLLFAGAIVYDWHLLINYGYFYPKLAGVAPFGALGSLVIVIFPSWTRRPSQPSRAYTAGVVIVMILGLILGGINFYLMNSYYP